MDTRASRVPWRVWVIVAAALCVVGCAGPSSAGGERLGRGVGGKAPVSFVFAGLDGSAISDAELRGRSTVLFFFTTFDPVSQVLAQQLGELLSRHRPRINVVGIVLEPPQNLVLVATYRDTLQLLYPLALADPATLAGGGVFGPIPQIPASVLLDRDGREVMRAEGASLLRAIESGLDELDRAMR